MVRYLWWIAWAVHHAAHQLRVYNSSRGGCVSTVMYLSQIAILSKKKNNFIKNYNAPDTQRSSTASLRAGMYKLKVN